MAVSETATELESITVPALFPIDEPGHLAGPGQPLVRVRELFKIYNEGNAQTVALCGANLDLVRGEFVTLAGASGSGKTTLLWCIAGLSLPSAGRIVLEGRDLTRLDESGRARIRAETMGLVFQRANLIPFLTAEENVAHVRTLRKSSTASGDARDLLGEMGLGDRRHHYPRNLSGGEVQRVGIAVALANDPMLLLGDEITGELDTATSERVMGLLFEAQRQRGLTVLVVTHNPELAARGDSRLTIVDGLVMAS